MSRSLAALTLAVAACGAPSAPPVDPTSAALTLPQAGGCNDAFVYAGTNQRLVALTIDDHLVDDACRGNGHVSRSYAATDPRVDLEQLVGRNLAINYCTDALSPNRRVTHTARPRAGTVRVELDTTSFATTHYPYSTARVRLEQVEWVDAAGRTLPGPALVEFTAQTGGPAFRAFDTGPDLPCPGAP